VFDSSTGYRLPGGNVRSPDVSFVRSGRFPEGKIPEGFCDVVPDLAVEVMSPEDRSRDILDKVGEYLESGVALVWVIDPGSMSAIAYESLTAVSTVPLDAVLDGGRVVPGFRAALRDILE
jgi:Uma2 family endonuclease